MIGAVIDSNIVVSAPFAALRLAAQVVSGLYTMTS